MANQPVKVSSDFGTAMQRLFPAADPLKDYLVYVDDEGVVWLDGWNLPGVPPTQAQVQGAISDIAWDAVRAIRAPLLEKTDTVYAMCGKAGVPFPAAWKDYWRALRDIPQNQSDPDSITWPVQPGMPSGV